MRIAYVSAGAAGMMCGSCLQDNTLAATLQRMGHDAVLIPTYTPLRTDETDVSMHEVFYGAINIYLQQKSALFRATPRFIDRWLDAPGLLGWAARRGSATVDATELGELTVAMLQGEDGPQRKELRRLTAWLRDEFHPEIVHLTNALFVGMAGPLRRELGVPVVCSLQGEDLFMEGLGEPHLSRVLETLRARARDVDAFVSTSQEYADRMGAWLGIPAGKLSFAGLGLKMEGHGPDPAAKDPACFTIGYMARIAPEKGLHQLVEALGILAQRPGSAGLRVRAAGYLGPRDQAYFAGVQERLAALNVADRFEYLGEVDRPGKIRLLQSLDVFSVPTVYRESKGRSVLEAMANAVPVVQPRHGSFPEMIEATGGGLLFEPGDPRALADALESLRADPARRLALGAAGREGVRVRYSDTAMAERTLAVYRAVLAAQGDRRGTGHA